MNIYAKTLLVVLFAFILSSCSELREVTTSNLKIGMTKREVEIILNKKPITTVAAKSFPEVNTIVEVVQYAGPRSNYYLYFVNDKLQKWTPANDHLLYLDDMVPNQTS